ncbi:hypothetical protein GCM10023194_41460 [Planotetraspora phitsanulokensis]|uniref:Regulatory protein n=1 Tax=Planotetraspora phitsanulokensis TaxID=575192 RepID=A0A8J3XIF4_9ACTN|nr:DUF5685 family protein [Planotetraspora phitsanulokensis]GII40866.1 hypothetical protein Pph01_58690 [Planotetraspora phitsanulokensis]
MFGIIRPCVDHSCGTVLTAWRAHLCGLCLTLRDRHGPFARMATNYDGLILSVLAEAQDSRPTARRTAGPCPLRGFRTADVISSGDQGARLAAVVSLALAAGKIRDHAADGDGVAARRISGAPLRHAAVSWSAAADRDAAPLGFDTAVLTEAVERQAALEAAPASSLLHITEPTETAVAAAFAHTAVLAGEPRNAESLREAGRLFGRIAHIIDAVEDLDEDRSRGRYNPLAATGTSLAEARHLCDEAAIGLGLAVRDLELRERHLVEALLVDETRRAVRRGFAERVRPPGPARKAVAGLFTLVTCGLYRPEWSSERDSPASDRCLLTECDCSGCSDCGDCCDCSTCSDCCDCNCCDCCSCDCGS